MSSSQKKLLEKESKDFNDFEKSDQTTIDHIKIIESNKSDDGTQVFEKIIKRSYKTLISDVSISPRQKTIITSIGIFYLFIIFISLFCSTYTDGKTAISKLKIASGLSQQEVNNLIWITVRNGCNENFTTNAYKAIMVPFTFITDIVPFIIIWMNSSSFDVSTIQN